MPSFTRQMQREGRQRLVAWIEEATEMAKDQVGAPAELSPIGKATFGNVTMENLAAVMIYPAPKGGWHADIVLKNVPPGVGNCFGSQVEHPLPTREKAEEFGKMVLASIIATIQRGKIDNHPPVFLLHGYSFPLVSELLNVAVGFAPDGYGSELRAEARIEETLAELCPEGFDPDKFNKEWSQDQRATLLSVLHTAALTGVLRYPLRKDGPPAKEA